MSLADKIYTGSEIFLLSLKVAFLFIMILAAFVVGLPMGIAMISPMLFILWAKR